ncbi:hypothetical protein [Phenylobacterium kunshanense]|uniref:Uncharacterized protein n=1 Tax=Phenylobacterium kunshanense TaxID=1445034 RepID=A0A328BJD1_9CAUL|nr:hypothetical protein [Phenylobacterium kunshanense]RAK67420.1 hypothetical protein DJ019_05750 [Phenylobacterium kunshanense]
MRTAFALAAIFLASPALAEEPPVATATPDAATSVADQIDAYLRSSPVLEVEPLGEVAGVVPADGRRDDGRIHGEVSVGVGTGGYRSVYVRTDMPLGETGRLSLAFGEARHGRAWNAPPLRCGLGGWASMDEPDRAGGPCRSAP